MTGEEHEKAIFKKMLKLWKRYKKYNPDGKYLSMSVFENDEHTTLCINNAYFNEDMATPLSIFKEVKNYEAD